MIKREEVEELLRDAEHWGSGLVPISPVALAELTRVWLRVNNSPAGEVANRGFTSNGNRITWLLFLDGDDGHFRDPTGKRIRLVPEADSGGDRG